MSLQLANMTSIQEWSLPTQALSKKLRLCVELLRHNFINEPPDPDLYHLRPTLHYTTFGEGGRHTSQAGQTAGLLGALGRSTLMGNRGCQLTWYLTEIQGGG